jgi:hypothetical protein
VVSSGAQPHPGAVPGIRRPALATLGAMAKKSRKKKARKKSAANHGKRPNS